MSSRFHLHQCRTCAVVCECVANPTDCTSFMNYECQTCKDYWIH